MKKNGFLLGCLMLSIIAFGQNSKTNKTTPPQFNGIKNVAETVNVDNVSLLNHYLKDNWVCSAKVAESKLEGTEMIQFTVTPLGDLTDFQVINSVDKGIDKNLIRCLEKTNGMWTPGYINGEPVAMKHEVSMLIGDYNPNIISNHFIREAAKYFELAGKAFYKKDNLKKALRNYNQGINYMPNDKALLLFRGLCHFELGDKESAEKDWSRVAALGGDLSFVSEYDILATGGYSEMKKILANKPKN